PRCDSTGRANPAGEAGVTVVEANDAEAPHGESLAERVRPRDKLHAEAHDQEDDRRVGWAELFVLDGYAVRAHRGHELPALSDREAPARQALAIRPQPSPVIIPPTARTRPRGKSDVPLAITLLARPGRQIVSPARHAAQPCSATAAGDMTMIEGTDWPSRDPRIIEVSVNPGHNAVAVTPEPRNSCESASVSDRT